MRFRFGFFFFALAITVILLSTSVHAADDATIQGARKEAAVVVYTSMTVEQAPRRNDAFKTKYPFIQPSMFRAVGERLLTKIKTQAQAGRPPFHVDVDARNHTTP